MILMDNKFTENEEVCKILDKITESYFTVPLSTTYYVVPLAVWMLSSIVR
jgi:hypothetical protein